MNKQSKLKICNGCGGYIITYNASKGLCHKCYYKRFGSEWHKKYYLKNKERIKKRINTWRKNNLEAEYLRHKKYREKNKDILRQKKKEYRGKNKEKISKHKSNYKKENWYWIKKHKLHYYNEKRKNDINLSVIPI